MMDKKLLDALNNLSLALSEISDALKKDDKAKKSATTQALQGGNFIKEKLVDGEIIYANGIEMEGKFENEQLIDGIIIQDEIEYNGIFKNGELVEGTVTMEEGDILSLEGTFKNKKITNGKIIFTNGIEAEGDWKHKNNKTYLTKGTIKLLNGKEEIISEDIDTDSINEYKSKKRSFWLI